MQWVDTAFLLESLHQWQFLGWRGGYFGVRLAMLVGSVAHLGRCSVRSWVEGLELRRKV